MPRELATEPSNAPRTSDARISAPGYRATRLKLLHSCNAALAMHRQHCVKNEWFLVEQDSRDLLELSRSIRLELADVRAADLATTEQLTGYLRMLANEFRGLTVIPQSVVAGVEQAPDATGEVIEAIRRRDVEATVLALENEATGIRAPSRETELVLARVGIAARVRGLLGLVHARFQRLGAVDVPPSGLLAGVAQGANDTLATIRERFFEIRANPVALAREREGFAANTYAAILALTDVAHSLYRELRSETLASSEQRRLGRAAIEAHASIRAAIATDAAIEAVLSLLPESVTPLLESRNELQTDLPNARDVEIGALASAEAERVEIRGRVVATSASRTPDNKLVGTVRLRDPGAGAEVLVAMLFVNPRTVGITEGAFLQAVGTYRERSEWVRSPPAFEVEPLAFNELAGGRWAVAIASSTSDWFARWPNRSHLSWSLGPTEFFGDDGELAPGSHAGAAELVFPPHDRKFR